MERPTMKRRGGWLMKSGVVNFLAGQRDDWAVELVPEVPEGAEVVGYIILSSDPHQASGACSTCGSIGYTHNPALEMPVQDCPDCSSPYPTSDAADQPSGRAVSDGS